MRPIVIVASEQVVPGVSFSSSGTCQLLGGTLDVFYYSLMVPIEEPIHKYFQGPRNYNPDFVLDSALQMRLSGAEELRIFRRLRHPNIAAGPRVIWASE